MKKILILIFSFGVLNSQNLFPNLGGQRSGISTMSFLKLNTSARGVGMADALVAISDDIASIQQNPASAIVEEKNSFYFFTNKWFADIQNQNFTYLHHLSTQDAIALSVTSLSSSDMEKRTVTMPYGTGEYVNYTDFTIGFTYARALTDQFKFGGTIKFANEQLAEITSRAILIDLGARYFINYKTARFAFAFSNFGTSIKPKGKINEFGIGEINNFGEFSPPTIFRLGFAFEPILDETHRLTSSVQLNHPNDNSENLGIGFEYAWHEHLFLRIGKKINVEEQKNISFGFGVNKKFDFSNFIFDYGVTSFGDLGISHSISILSEF